MFTFSEIKKATQARVKNFLPTRTVHGVSINSRILNPGDLFIAVKGERFDGHDFIPQAVRGSARAVVVSRPIRSLPKHFPVFIVKDTVKALGELARLHRERFSIPLIAITGSAGKTTTKEWIASVLEKDLKILKNPGTQNNFIGVPLTLLRINASHQAVLLEFGTNRPGDIPWLAHVADPDIAVFTTIGESHLELLKSPQDVFSEKTSLIRLMKTQGTVVYNGDNPYLEKIPRLFPGRKFIKVGIRNSGDYTASDIKVLSNQSLTFTLNRRKTVTIRTPVYENITNALIAISCGRLMGMNYNKIIPGIEKFRFTGNRQGIRRIRGCWIIDDTYNANPVSFRSALQTLSALRVKGRKILVCGDMRELGQKTKPLHEQMGLLAADLNVDVILTFGKQSSHLGRSANSANPQILTKHFTKKPLLHRALGNLCRRGDAVLIKGSRSMAMDQTADFLQRRLQQRP